MKYSKDYPILKNIITSNEAQQSIDNVEFCELAFKSLSHKILPGADNYHCTYHDIDLRNTFSFYNNIGTIDNNIHIEDINVSENEYFKYRIVKPKGIDKLKEFVFLFHGFNEKDWTKYLPWAKALCEKTQKAIVLFPIAFHMQRAPKHWSDKREMYKLSEVRKKRFPNVINSTLFNVAISMRLHSMPQRFIWSGFQSYYDVLQFIDECRAGNVKYIDKDFKFDIFAYSIGGFLALILKLVNFDNYFDQTKIAMFCSGATFNRLSPVSKFILDSESNVALYSFLVEHFEKMLEKDNLLNHYMRQGHLEGRIFYAMLDYQKERDFRENLLRKYEHQIYAITLKKDKIIPSFEVVNTLKGAYRDINIKVEELDFNHNYTHENPFPINTKEQNKIDDNFEMVFNKISEFIN